MIKPMIKIGSIVKPGYQKGLVVSRLVGGLQPHDLLVCIGCIELLKDDSELVLDSFLLLAA